MQERGGDVIHAGSQAHDAEAVLYAWPHHKDGAGDVVAIGEIMLGDDRSGFFMVGMGVRIFFFKLPQRLDAVVRDDHHVRVFIHVLQNCAKHFIESDVLIREGVLPDVINVWIVAGVERRDGIQPVPGTVFARLRQEGEICGVLG